MDSLGSSVSNMKDPGNGGWPNMSVPVSVVRDLDSIPEDGSAHLTLLPISFESFCTSLWQATLAFFFFFFLGVFGGFFV